MLSLSAVPTALIVVPSDVVILAVAALLWLQAALKLLALAHRPRPVRLPDPEAWPRYTVLVPLFQEAATLPRLVQALSRLDYPANRLQILMVCEADDPLTLSAMPPLPAHFTVVRVPPSQPRTKPKALRVAMREATGELITIYDAEDSPHPGQLKQAARALLSDPALAAVQAPLRVDNLAPGWIARQFALEYAGLFYTWVPGLCAAGVPSPLGGTSNHIRRSALEDAGGWDAWNVTEDADLTFRLAMSETGRIGWIDLPTEEEAVETFRLWRNQRSRWIKGFAQTWIAHMKAPLAPGGWRGARRFLALQATIGLTLLSTLFHLPTLLWVVWKAASGSPPSPVILALGGAFYGSGVVVVATGARRAGLRLRAGDLLTVPFYWMLLTWPAWVAMVDLVRRPSYWNKTPHGVSARPTLEPAPCLLASSPTSPT